MERVNKLYNVLQKERSSCDNDNYFLLSSHEAKLRLDWSWGASEKDTEAFDVVFFGDDIAQECRITINPQL